MKLSLAQMFTWFALFTFFIYATPAVTSFQFGSVDPRSEAYNSGANWVGVLMAVYNGVAALAASFYQWPGALAGLRPTSSVLSLAEPVCVRCIFSSSRTCSSSRWAL